jgi:hypothetical protein
MGANELRDLAVESFGPSHFIESAASGSNDELGPGDMGVRIFLGRRLT